MSVVAPIAVVSFLPTLFWHPFPGQSSVHNQGVKSYFLILNFKWCGAYCSVPSFLVWATLLLLYALSFRFIYTFSLLSGATRWSNNCGWRISSDSPDEKISPKEITETRRILMSTLWYIETLTCLFKRNRTLRIQMSYHWSKGRFLRVILAKKHPNVLISAKRNVKCR